MCESERFSLTIDRITAVETSSRILPAMLPSHGYQGFRTAPIPTRWVQLGDTWVLWWNGLQIAQVSPAKERGRHVHLYARKIRQTKDEWAASLAQGKRYAERWCATRIFPEMRLRAAVVDCWTPRRPSSAVHCWACRLLANNSRPGAWLKPGAWGWRDQGSARSGQSSSRDQAQSKGPDKGMDEGGKRSELRLGSDLAVWACDR